MRVKLRENDADLLNELKTMKEYKFKYKNDCLFRKQF